MLWSFALFDVEVPRIGLGALGLLALAAALVDAVRLAGGTRFGRQNGTGAGQGGFGAGQGGSGTDRSGVPTKVPRPATEDVEQWLGEQAQLIAARQQELNERALAIQQWMQFPDALDLRSAGGRTRPKLGDQAATFAVDPMASHDRQLFELIETKTHELFDNIKQDAYRKDQADQKVFDTDRIRQDLVTLVSDVAAIYRPNDPAPLLQTNVEAISRATGRASLRLLVAVESLPGGLANYDFQSIYQLVIRAVRTFGMYKSAKPYLDIASGVLFAGRIAASTNPITVVAWWAASKATTYGASKLGRNLLDQQAVGLIRQLVEIVAVEVASIYSPMVRYRDVHWVYGVELVHLARELSIGDTALVQAMKQLAALNLRDEYGRVALMRQLACATSSRPWNYRPAESLSSSDRLLVAERLEAFLLDHVVHKSSRKIDKAAIERWQHDASDRLEIQFRVSKVDATEHEQTERAVWALVAFALQHFGDEVEQAIERLTSSRLWIGAKKASRTTWTAALKEEPPYLYHPPTIDPDHAVCGTFLEDLVELAAGCAAPVPDAIVKRLWQQPDLAVPRWSGEQALHITAYYLRSDSAELMQRYDNRRGLRLLADSMQKSVSPQVLHALETILAVEHGMPQRRAPSSGLSVRCVYEDAKIPAAEGSGIVVRIGDQLVCFSVREPVADPGIELTIHDHCDRQRAKIEKVGGYLRSDCRIRFPGGGQVDVPGSSLRSYDTYFAPLQAP